MAVRAGVGFAVGETWFLEHVYEDGIWLHSKRTRDVTRLVTRVGSCNGLQGCYKLVMIAFKACNAMQACNDQPMLVMII